MVVSSGIERAFNISTPSRRISWNARAYQAIVAFSGEREYGGTSTRFQRRNRGKTTTNPYRFLICCRQVSDRRAAAAAPMMYVDKPLSGIKAVRRFSAATTAPTPAEERLLRPRLQNNSEAISVHLRVTRTAPRPNSTAA